MPVAHLTHRTDLLLAPFLMQLILSRALTLSFSLALSHTLWLFVVHFLSLSRSLSFCCQHLLLKCKSMEQKAWEETERGRESESEREKGSKEETGVEKKQKTLSVP